jgi:N-acetyl-gamma-glutamyl-phosphate reductase
VKRVSKDFGNPGFTHSLQGKSMGARLFIDGEAGTTGLQIRSRLEGRPDLSFIRLSDSDRKNSRARARALNDADIAILCLPDDAAREAAALVDAAAGTRLIDASSAHHTAPDWVYGFPEYDRDARAAIAAAARVSNPGCYAITSVAILHPLIVGGLLPADAPVTINAVSGYSGGGKALIAAFEDPTAANATDENFRVYGLSLAHKHVPEIQARAGLSHPPLFVPSVGRFAQGMLVQVPLPLWSLPGSADGAALHAMLADHYAGERYVEVMPLQQGAASATLEPEALNGTNLLRLHVFANDAQGQAVIVGQIDNLGKGASGQAVQTLNIMLGLPEEEGLDRPARIA